MDDEDIVVEVVEKEGEGEREVPDDSICPVCRTTTYVGETISCETCLYWFHFGCVGVTHSDACVIDENEPYFCPSCKKAAAAKAKASKAKATSKTKAAPKTPKPPKKTKETSSKSTPSRTKETPSRPKETPTRYKDTPIRPKETPIRPKETIKDAPPPPIKLKISLGSPDKAAKASLLKAVASPPTSPALLSPDHVRKRSGGASDNEDEEEEKWLDAVESGNVDSHVDSELRSIKNPKLMTARQRAMKAAAGADDVIVDPMTSPHISLERPLKKTNAVVEVDRVEQMRQKAIKAIKRKEIELEKREESKKKTMDRLLKKKESKFSAKNSAAANASNASPAGSATPTGVTAGGASVTSLASACDVIRKAPTITYKIDRECRPSLFYPEGYDYPISSCRAAAFAVSSCQTAAESEKSTAPPTIIALPKTVMCSVCQVKPKKYNCSRTSKPLCSLACYKANLQSAS